MSTVFGIPAHEFSVACSDFLLFLESLVLAWMLRRPAQGTRANDLRKSGICLFLFLGASSLLGAVYHAFFSDAPESTGSAAVWMLTAASIGLVATTLWHGIARILDNRTITKNLRAFEALFLAAYLGTILFVNSDYLTVILFYAPPVLILGGIAAWKSVTTRASMWGYLVLGILLSLGAAATQTLEISLDPVYLNFNTLYHILQGIALPFIAAFYAIYDTTPNRRA